MSEVLVVAGADKRYGGTRALNGAAIHLRAGEWLALLGPNGAGKTTLIRAIAGRVRLDSGSIRLLDQDLHTHPRPAEARRRLGVVPQEIALYPLLTARENLAAFAALHGVPRGEAADRVRWALQWTGLEDRADAAVKTFSGGMKRRLNIACGVLHRPSVVLLDEPTVGVDPQSRERIWAMLAQLRDGGAALLLTTHQLDEAERVCDRITIIDHGRVIADGTMEQLTAQTVGFTRQVTLSLDHPAPLHLEVEGEFSADRRAAKCPVADVARDLPPLLTRFADIGMRVEDVCIDRPSLHAVFMHLTGRELRQ